MVLYIIKFGVIVLAVLPVWLLVRRPWKRKQPREWALGAFALFVAGLLALTLEGEYGTPGQMAGRALTRIETGEGVNVVPFRAISQYMEHFNVEVLGINLIGNIVMFIPWGFGLVLLWKKNRHPAVIAAFSLGLPLLIETCQLFIGRSVDVDDLLLNFTGSCLGAGIFSVLRRKWPGLDRFSK